MFRATAVVALLLAVLFAGCQVPGFDPADDFEGTCPSWTRNPSSNRDRWEIPYNESIKDKVTLTKEEVYGKGSEHHNDLPLDKVDIDIGVLRLVDGSLRLQAFRGETAQTLELHQYGPDPARAEVRFGPGTHENASFFVRLTEDGDPPAPVPVRLLWTFEPDEDGDDATTSRIELDYTVTRRHLQEGCF